MLKRKFFYIILCSFLIISFHLEADETHSKLKYAEESSYKSIPESAKTTLNSVSKAIKPTPAVKDSTKISIDKAKKNPNVSNVTLSQDNDKIYNDDVVLSSEIKNATFKVAKQKNGKKQLNVNILLEEAYKADSLGQIEAATVLYKDILASNPDNMRALFGLAVIYQKSKETEKARVLYSRVLEKNPSDSYALNNFLSVIGEEAPYDAINELTKLAEINPTISTIPAQIGMIYYKVGDKSKAVKYLNRALLLSPDNFGYQYNLAIINDSLGKKKDAIVLYKKLLQSDKIRTLPLDSIQKINERVIYLMSLS